MTAFRCTTVLLQMRKCASGTCGTAWASGDTSGRAMTTAPCAVDASARLRSLARAGLPKMPLCHQSLKVVSPSFLDTSGSGHLQTGRLERPLHPL